MMRKIIKNTMIATTIMLAISMNIKAATFIDNENVHANKNWASQFLENINFNVITKQEITTVDCKGEQTDLVLSLAQDTNVVTFKDINLEKVVREAVNKPNGTLYKSDVEEITKLYASGKI